MGATLILTYHAVEPGPSPLCVEPGLFAAHLDCVVDAGARVVSVRELASALPAGDPRGPTVAIAFDDGFASVAHTAAPLLVERGLAATIFCVAGRLGASNDWESQPAWVPRLELASAGELAKLRVAGFEIASHGSEHAPLVRCASEALLRRELVDSKRRLEEEVQAPVSSFAYPYGVLPDSAGRRLLERTYSAACTTTLAAVGPGADPYELPRVDAHYIRRPALLRRAVRGSLGPYLVARRAGVRARRALVSDFAGGAR